MNEKRERQSNYELLKIIAMLMIVSHHFIAKNAFNVDTEITGITFNKLFLQFIGNHAFIGNNLFFMCSAWFLVDKKIDFSSFPRPQLKHIWSMEKKMLFYSIGLWIMFRITEGGGTATLSMLAKSVFPLSTNLWWYPTTYAVFLLIQPFYHKGLEALEKDTLCKLILTMTCIWSVSSLVPFFNYGASNFLCFIMLYAVVFQMKRYGIEKLTKRNCKLIIITGYAIAAASIVLLDVLGTHITQAGDYACYFIRGNNRLLPFIISIAIFRLSTEWKIQSKVINYVASLTLGIYLIHMYPLMMECLFSKSGAVFDMTRYDSVLPTCFGIVVCFFGCTVVEAIRDCVERSVFKLLTNKRR